MSYHRILTIQDISCVGQCSMTVALPILSACGQETCILPTALLSTHTGGFGWPVVRHLSESMEDTWHHWQEQGITFDAIYVGYLGNVEAVRQAGEIMENLLAPGGMTFVDPAMADHGKLYTGFDETYARAMMALCRKASVILPNITEAAMLADLPWQEALTEDYVNRLMSGITHPRVILTGVGYSPEETGILVRDAEMLQYYRHRRFPKNYHGPGDIFASCCIGAVLRGKSLFDAVKIAGDMVCLCIENTEKSPAHWYGVKFETMLPELIRRLEA